VIKTDKGFLVLLSGRGSVCLSGNNLRQRINSGSRRPKRADALWKLVVCPSKLPNV
jgi:hypothetical protein